MNKIKEAFCQFDNLWDLPAAVNGGGSGLDPSGIVGGRDLPPAVVVGSQDLPVADSGGGRDLPLAAVVGGGGLDLTRIVGGRDPLPAVVVGSMDLPAAAVGDRNLLTVFLRKIWSPPTARCCGPRITVNPWRFFLLFAFLKQR